MKIYNGKKRKMFLNSLDIKKRWKEKDGKEKEKDGKEKAEEK